MQKKFSGARQAEIKEANSLVSYTKRTLDKCRMDKDNCFVQTQNGANVKNWVCSGVEYLLKKKMFFKLLVVYTV
jgi:hypothetical protein